jgi:hypothetical protein
MSFGVEPGGRFKVTVNAMTTSSSSGWVLAR